jgi:hypothetical protein
VACALLTCAAGCKGPGRRQPLRKQVAQIAEQQSDLQIRLEQTQRENEQLRKQIETLTLLPDNKKAEMFGVKSVKIGRYTNLYDENNDGVEETLVVYVQPLDEIGDAVKAAGAANVQVWDLSKPSAEALVADWSLDTDKLKKLWVDSIALIGYRLAFDVSKIRDKLNFPLTIKVTFTDYLSGRTFNEQFILRPRKPTDAKNK